MTGVQRDGSCMVCCMVCSPPTILPSADHKCLTELKRRQRAGPIANDGKEPQDREGLLWDALRECVDAGYKVDARSYYTSFRVTDKESVGGLKEKLASLPEGMHQPPALGDICSGCFGR